MTLVPYRFPPGRTRSRGAHFGFVVIRAWMRRTPEPELMDEPAQVRAYAEADFSEPHDRFVDLFARRFPHLQPREILDLGCGPGDVSRRLARAFPSCQVIGIDGAPAMLATGKEKNRLAGLDGRIHLHLGYLPDAPLPKRTFCAIVSNSLLHHLARPSALWSTVRRAGAIGTAVFVMDLRRPPSAEAALALVEQYAADEPEILRRDFENSLHAAYREDEIRGQLLEAGLDSLTTEVVSDRHLIVHGTIPSPLEDA